MFMNQLIYQYHNYLRPDFRNIHADRYLFSGVSKHEVQVTVSCQQTL